MKKIILASLLALTSTSYAFASDNAKALENLAPTEIKLESAKFTVFFNNESSELSDANIEGLGSQIMSYNPSKVYITGNAIDYKSKDKNLELSQDRADVVRDFLAMQGLNSSTIVSVSGVGQTNPLCKNKTETCKASNRRVEITIEYIK